MAYVFLICDEIDGLALLVVEITSIKSGNLATKIE
jgi:hypothetical protein